MYLGAIQFKEDKPVIEGHGFKNMMEGGLRQVGATSSHSTREYYILPTTKYIVGAAAKTEPERS